MKIIEWRGRPKCPLCGSLNVHRDGMACYYGLPKQRYQCGDCGKRFRPILRTESVIVEREKVEKVCDYIEELENCVRNSEKASWEKISEIKKIINKMKRKSYRG